MQLRFALGAALVAALILTTIAAVLPGAPSDWPEWRVSR
jgi:hypothetical protein